MASQRRLVLIQNDWYMRDFLIQLLPVWSFKVITYERHSKFKRDKRVTEKYIKLEMVANLIQSGVIAGKDSDEVKTIPGEPENRNDSLQTWNYYMGQGGGGAGFTIHYLVKFSADSVSTIRHQKIVD